MSTSNNNNNNNNSSSSSHVLRVGRTPQKPSVKRTIDVMMTMDDYERFKDYKKYMKEKNIEIPSGQSEYSQRLANLDLKYNKLKQLYKNLNTSYTKLYKECKENNTITRYGTKRRRIMSSTKTKRKRGEEVQGFNENEAFRNLGINGIVIGESTI